MKWFLDLTTRGKLFAAFWLMIALLAITIAAAYLGIAAIRESQKLRAMKSHALRSISKIRGENAREALQRCAKAPEGYLRMEAERLLKVT